MRRLAPNVMSGRLVSTRRLLVIAGLFALAGVLGAVAIAAVTVEGALGEGCGSPVSPKYGEVLGDRHCRVMAAKAAKGTPISGGASLVVGLVGFGVLVFAPKTPRPSDGE